MVEQPVAPAPARPTSTPHAGSAQAADGGISAAEFSACYAANFSKTVRGLRRQFGFDRATTEDMAQDAWTKAWGKRSDFRGESLFHTWVYRIAFNCAVEQIRRRRGRTETSVIPEQQIEYDPLCLMALDRALARVSTRDRALLHAKFVDGFSLAEMAAFAECPVNRIKNWVYRAMQTACNRNARTLSPHEPHHRACAELTAR